MTRRVLPAVTLLLILPFAAQAEQPGRRTADKDRLPMSGLSPSKVLPGLCVLKYRVTTNSQECQDLIDQGLGYYYSYIWMEAARSFETAAKKDPECAMAWWCLSRALEQYGKGGHNDALKKAQALMNRASSREQLLITARLEEKGIKEGVGDPEARKKAAIKTIDTLLTLYDDDEEGWYYRAQLAGGAGLHGGQVSAVPFYKALLRVNPLHPGANHELVHFYETFKRPALGWPYAEAYIKSSPGLPHALHMQAHLGMRIGRWDKSVDWSLKAVQLEKEYHKVMNVSPAQDQQYAHHLETLAAALTHDGRFVEAHKVKKECDKLNIKLPLPWFRMLLAEHDYDQALKVAGSFRTREKATYSYLAALVYLHRGEIERAAAEVNVLRQSFQGRRSDKQTEIRLWEVQGLLMCRQGEADAGLKLLKKAVDKTINDYSFHAWGNGAYYMEAWGLAALQSHKDDVAEEAFLEAVAHDSGCVRAALGLQVLCERQGRIEEASRYGELARRCWARADAGCLETEMGELRSNSAAKTVPEEIEP